ncbi:MAG: hypothetical protein R8K48_07425 [Gallionella sp.]
MKQFGIILISLLIGGLIGMGLGNNMARNKPLISNPFEKETFSERMLHLGNEAMEKSGKALEKTGKALQGK